MGTGVGIAAARVPGEEMNDVGTGFSPSNDGLKPVATFFIAEAQPVP